MSLPTTRPTVPLRRVLLAECATREPLRRSVTLLARADEDLEATLGSLLRDWLDGGPEPLGILKRFIGRGTRDHCERANVVEPDLVAAALTNNVAGSRVRSRSEAASRPVPGSAE